MSTMTRMWIAATVTLALLGGGCTDPPLVVQGQVVAVDEAGKTLKLRDELAPHAEVSFFLEGADIGAPPTVGNVLRIAYRVKDGRNAATRVMNLTRRAELAGKGGGGH